MQKPEIVLAPASVLFEKAAKVTEIDDAVVRQTKDMLDIIVDRTAALLAANQIGKLNRIFVMHTFILGMRYRKLVCINPEILATSDKMREREEGCLSIPDFKRKIIRPSELTLRYWDIKGREHTHDFGNHNATVIQHEIDHLDGVLITHRPS